MTLEYVDTNIFVRYLTGDHPDQSQRAAAFFKDLEEGRRHATTCEGVLVEVVHVLASKLYSFPRERVRAVLSDLLDFRGLRLPQKGMYQRALDLYASQRLPFVDALCVAHMEQEGISTVISFDRGYDRMSGITRLEP